MQATPPATPPLGGNTTNAQLNLSVLQRHNPSIIHVLSIAPYSVIYTFSTASQAWEKSGIEGTLFVCQLASTSAPNDAIDKSPSEEHYSVFVLNRRGLDNFEINLTTDDDVEVTEEYVILQDQAHNVIYGLWIFAEPSPSSTAQMRDINAKVIQHCAHRAVASRQAVQEAPAHRPQKHSREPSTNQVGYDMIQSQHLPADSLPNQPTATDMARHLSLRELFGQPRPDIESDNNKNNTAGTHYSSHNIQAPAQTQHYYESTQQTASPLHFQQQHQQSQNTYFPQNPQYQYQQQPQYQHQYQFQQPQQHQYRQTFPAAPYLQHQHQYQSPPPPPPQQPQHFNAPQSDVLGDLFQRARQRYP